MLKMKNLTVENLCLIKFCLLMAAFESPLVMQATEHSTSNITTLSPSTRFSVWVNQCNPHAWKWELSLGAVINHHSTPQYAHSLV